MKAFMWSGEVSGCSGCCGCCILLMVGVTIEELLTLELEKGKREFLEPALVEGKEDFFS